MQHEDIENLAVILNNSGHYRVTKKYQRPEYYNTGDEDDKMIAVFLDIETTGLSYTQDKLIELGMVKFEYNRQGSIFRLLDDFSGYQDPSILIPKYITELTGINDDTVRSHKIQESAVANYLQDVDLIITHNAQFDRTFLEVKLPSLLFLQKLGVV